MGQAVKMTDAEHDRVWALITECAEAGVVFRPKEGRLRPELTKGRPPEGLLARVKGDRERILRALAEATDFEDLEISD